MNYIYQFLNSLKVYDTDLNKIRIGPNHDGGYILTEKFSKNDESLISIGIGDDISFDLAFREINNFKKIYLYDKDSKVKIPSIKNFELIKKNVAVKTDVKNNFIGINQLLDKFNKKITLKVDIEGNEWDIIDNIDIKHFNLISQMVIEFHIIHIDVSKDFLKKKYTPYFTKFYLDNYDLINNNLFKKYLRIMEKVNKYFYIFHAHPNNSLKEFKIGKLNIPPLLELSFINKKLVNYAKLTKKKFPIKNLDFANKNDRDDIINFYPFTKK